MRLQSVRLALALAIITCLAAICLAATGDSNRSNEGLAAGQPTTNDGAAQTARSRFTLQKLFDFERFKQVFKKRYSIVEELARAKLFLARAFRSFVSAVSYKNRKASSYLAINHMSDWTPSEVRNIDLDPDALMDILENMKPHGDETSALDSESGRATENEPLPAVSLSEVESKLREISESGNDQPAMKLIMEEITGPKSSGRKRRDVGAGADGGGSGRGSKRDISVSDLAREPSGEAADVGQRVASNNPLYEPPELVSFGSKDTTAKNRLPWRDANNIINLPGAKFLESVVRKATEVPSSSNDDGSKNLPDEVFIDLRDECMFAPRNQGTCGSCYAFAAVAVYEWLYCKATGKKVAFSEQYLVDCGLKSGLDGCNGGYLSKIPDFIRKYGMELRVNYPYRARLDQCPYENSTPHNAMGYLRIATRDFEYVDESIFEDRLKKGPMVLSIYVSDAFHEYGGGVHDGAGCDEDRAHAVVLVGSGREDNEEYWLFRNSYSAEYGEGGYYKLNKKSKHCIAYEQAYQYSGLTGLQKDEGVNARYRSRAIKRRYRQYLLS